MTQGKLDFRSPNQMRKNAPITIAALRVQSLLTTQKIQFPLDVTVGYRGVSGIKIFRFDLTISYRRAFPIDSESILSET